MRLCHSFRRFELARNDAPRNSYELSTPFLAGLGTNAPIDKVSFGIPKDKTVGQTFLPRWSNKAELSEYLNKFNHHYQQLESRKCRSCTRISESAKIMKLCIAKYYFENRVLSIDNQYRN